MIAADDAERARRRIVQLAYGLFQRGAPGSEALLRPVARRTRVLRRTRTKRVPWRRGWAVGTHPWRTSSGIKALPTYVREDGSLVARDEDGQWLGPEGLATDDSLIEIAAALERFGAGTH